MASVKISYQSVISKFSEYHKSEGNVWAHLLTTSLGLLGVASVLQRSLIHLSRMGKKAALPRFLSVTVWILYAIALAQDVPRSVARSSACILVTVGFAAIKLDWGFGKGIVAIAAGYILQDLAHWYFGEETYQQNSWGGKNGLSIDKVLELWLEHCYYLLPLTLSCATSQARILASLVPIIFLSWSNYALDSDSIWGLPFLAAKKRLLIGKLGTNISQETNDMRTIQKWVMDQNPATDQTSHWWVQNMNREAQFAFERLVNSITIKALFETKFHPDEYTIEPVRGMNEIYVSAPSKRAGPKTSDDVFFTEHVDGPFCFFPFASVYRCILAIDENQCEFTTHFPNAFHSLAARNGDILAFDFHRESHYITQKYSGGNKHRIVLKLHYVTAPTSLFWLCGRLLRFLSVKYNQLFRALFLATIQPTSKSTIILADLGVVGFTVLYNAIEKFIGYANLTYYIALTITSLTMHSYALFLYATQFLHYLRYISTYFDRKNVAFGTFKRDVLLFKSIALAQLFRLYLKQGMPHPLSLIGVFLGYFISIKATQALGVDGTYFGIELNVVKKDYKFVTMFPYNIIPHPMILGQCFAIASMHFGSTYLRTHYPLLCPIHIGLYLTHLTQEAFDFHDGIPWYKQSIETKS